MSGWDVSRKLALTDPWADFWVELYEEPQMGLWLDLQAAAQAAMKELTPESVEGACRAIEPLVKAHNITDRDGKPIKELSLRTLSAGLFKALLLAVQRALAGEGLPPSPAKRERSRGPSSPASRPRRASRSGS